MSNANVIELDNNAIMRLDESSAWLIEQATGRLYLDNSYSEKLIEELARNFKLTFEASPQFNVVSELPRYIIKARGIYYDIKLLTSAEYEDNFYEYWVILITSLDWATNQANKCKFIVTKTRKKTEKRMILKKEIQFFHNFKIDGKEVISLDYENDLKLRYSLLPWYFRDCYENYQELKEEEVVIRKDGSYTIIPYINH